MILATKIFMTARNTLDIVPDAFAFFCQTSSLAEALEKSLSSRVADSLTLSVTSSGTSAVVRNFWFIRLNWFLENRVFRVPAFVPKV